MSDAGFKHDTPELPNIRGRHSKALRNLRANGGAIISMVVLMTVVICAIFSPIVAPHDPTHRAIANRLLSPFSARDGAIYVLGTDAVGRDVLSRIIYGTRTTLLIGLASVALAGTVGVGLGLLAGYFGGWRDSLIMRIVDIQLSVPFIVLAIVVAGLLGNSLRNVILVLGLTGWVEYGRVIRGVTLTLRETDFVEAARAAGARDLAIISRQILPNVQASVIVLATLMMAKMLIAEASLSFLGLGVPASLPTWGLMIAEGRDYLVRAWWVCAFPGLSILVTVMAINILGDWLRDALDPRHGE